MRLTERTRKLIPETRQGVPKGVAVVVTRISRDYATTLHSLNVKDSNVPASETPQRWLQH